MSANGYQQYYSSSDCSVFIENPNGSIQPVLLDRIGAIAWDESISSERVFGFGNSKYGFLTQGNLFVGGQIVFNFVHENYFAKTLNYIYTGAPADTINGSDLTSLTGTDFAQLTDAQISQIKSSAAASSVTQQQYTTSILNYPQNFNIRIVLNNSLLYTSDSNKVIIIKGVKITGSSMAPSIMGENGDDPIMQYYTFLAREVVTGTIT